MFLFTNKMLTVCVHQTSFITFLQHANLHLKKWFAFSKFL